ncbi:hypothetical protein [Rhodoferax aquaticus]|uniref:Uncharacterized protein n=1 Tax=Rhodoferax aquaticus TaxID=2527691 RepID=A0A515ESX3_9BURK|nr:hypothetical protein [Rhodoferax aquaticus]QDL55770.1 hypothetical protein EXZ61_17200 [Rhodoferax aquaticus]
MNNFNLGIKGLSEGETNFIRDLLSSMTIDPDFKWIYSSKEPFDAYIADAETYSHLEIPYVSDIEIVLAGAPSNKLRLSRPIDAPSLKACLIVLQRVISSQQYTLDLVQPKLFTSETNNQQVSAGLKGIESLESIAEEKYQLIRWPHQVAIRGSKDRVRLSNFLIGRAWSIRELAISSGVALEECISFIAILKSLRLVLISSSEVPDKAKVVEFLPSKKKAVSHANRGFISSLRRKLGL